MGHVGNNFTMPLPKSQTGQGRNFPIATR